MIRFHSLLTLLVVSTLAASSCAPTDGIRPAAHGPVAGLIDLGNADLVSSSRDLAAEAIRAEPLFDQRLDHISRRLLSRELDEGERTYLTGPRDQAAAFYRSHPAAATELAGPLAADASLDPVELATWTVMTSQVPAIETRMAKAGWITAR